MKESLLNFMVSATLRPKVWIAIGFGLAFTSCSEVGDLASTARVAPRVLPIERGVPYIAGSETSEWSSWNGYFAARATSASAAASYTAQAETFFAHVTVVDHSGAVSTIDEAIPGQPTSLALATDNAAILSGRIRFCVEPQDRSVGCYNQAFMQTMGSGMPRITTLGRAQHVIAALALDKESGVALTYVELDRDERDAPSRQASTTEHWLVGLGGRAGRSVSVNRDALQFRLLGANMLNGTVLLRSDEQLAVIHQSHEKSMYIAMFETDLTRTAAREFLGPPQSRRWISAAARAGGGLVIAGTTTSVTSKPTLWRIVAALDANLQTLWTRETPLGELEQVLTAPNSAWPSPSVITFGALPLLATTAQDRILVLDVFLSAAHNAPALGFTQIPPLQSAALLAHPLMANVAGTSAPGTAGRPTFVVETLEGAKIIITDNWGRTSIPDPDPCGGDGLDACNDGDLCTADGCTEAGCVHTKRAEGELCDLDGRVCQAGACVQP